MIFNVGSGAGKMYSVLNISTDELELHGETVTATHGSYSVSGVFDDEGKCTLKVEEVGNYNLTCGEATGSVNVPYFGIYSVEVSTIYSTLNITTDDEELLGQTVTAVKGSYSVSGIMSNEGICILRVKELGTYTITCGEDSETVNVSQWYQTYNVEMSITPVALVPTMTSDTTPYGHAYSSSNRSGYSAYKAFVFNDTTQNWLSASKTPSRVYYQFVNPVIPKRASFNVMLTSGSLPCTAYTLQGSNDGSTWTDLKSGTVSTEGTVEVDLSDVETNYNYLGIYITNGNWSSGYGCSQLQFYGHEA